MNESELPGLSGTKAQIRYAIAIRRQAIASGRIAFNTAACVSEAKWWIDRCQRFTSRRDRASV